MPRAELAGAFARPGVDAMGTCDAKCPAHAQVAWWRAEGRRELTLCQHHSDQHGPALIAAGYTATRRLGAEADTLADVEAG